MLAITLMGFEAAGCSGMIHLCRRASAQQLESGDQDAS